MSDLPINNPLPIRLTVEQITRATENSNTFFADLAKQLLDVMRENERLSEMLDHMRQVFTERNIPYKESDNGN